LVNVDLTPDVAVRLAAALGTALKRGERVVASREGGAACRMIKRVMIAGVGRHLVKSENFAAGFHVGISPSDPEAIRIQFFEQQGIEMTPDTAVRLAAAFGTALRRGARVVSSREGTPACRMIKRAMISGLSSTGVGVADLRAIPAGVGRHLLKSEGYAAGFHVGISPSDPEAIRIQFFEQPGIEMTPDMQKEVEKHFTRGELRRVAAGDVGSISYPVRVRESYAADLLATLDVEAVRARGFRIVVDYGFSASSYVLPLVLGPLGVEAVAAHAFPSEGESGPPGGLAASMGQAKRLVPAVGSDLGAVFDRAGERLYLIDEKAREIPVEQALLLYLSLLRSSGRSGTLAFPVTVTSQVDRLVEGTELEIVRTRASLPELTKAAVEDGVIFAGAVGGGYVFPDFMPGYDAVASLAKLLELLATVQRPISELVAELPAPTLVHHQLPCPWALKGLIMRVLNERMAGREVDLTDGIKVFSDRGWAQVLPDPDEPLVHLYAEGETAEESEELAGELREVIEAIQQGEEATART
ncbi:MAG: mannose-phosphate guanylyltransferase / phosphomannomutase, partial [Gaiellaceae bacterium]|nr:mannose-phosphate guanylyltransferase / phosphomannomutase [Gaiellaceae bacterium]